jgi:hypothetical protein
MIIFKTTTKYATKLTSYVINNIFDDFFYMMYVSAITHVCYFYVLISGYLEAKFMKW